VSPILLATNSNREFSGFFQKRNGNLSLSKRELFSEALL